MIDRVVVRCRVVGGRVVELASPALVIVARAIAIVIAVAVEWERWRRG